MWVSNAWSRTTRLVCWWPAGGLCWWPSVVLCAVTAFSVLGAPRPVGSIIQTDYTRLQDSSKKKRLHSKNTSAGYRGVRKNGKSKMSFQAQIQIDNKLKYLGTGTHETPKEAALAFDRAVVKHKLSSSKLNYPRRIANR